MIAPGRGKQTVSLSQKAYDILEETKKKGETISDVVIRLTVTKIAGLQRRGEKEITTSDGRRLVVRIDQDKCAGTESRVQTAPSVFALDPSELGGFRRGAQPLGMREVEEETVDSDTIVVAAKSCPYRSVYVKTSGTEKNSQATPDKLCFSSSSYPFLEQTGLDVFSDQQKKFCITADPEVGAVGMKGLGVAEQYICVFALSR